MVSFRSIGRVFVPGVALLVASTACTADLAQPELFEPPARYSVTGEASGTNDGFTIACTMSLVFEWDGLEPIGGSYMASGGGEMERIIESPDGSGLVFRPYLFSDENHVRIVSADSIVLETPENLETGIPFYDGIAVMAGRITGPDTAEGAWTCGQLEIDEDRAGSVEGTWRLAPL